MCSFDYYKLTVNIAGGVFLELQKEGSMYDNPKTEMDILNHVTIRAYLILSEQAAQLFAKEE